MKFLMEAAPQLSEVFTRLLRDGGSVVEVLEQLTARRDGAGCCLIIDGDLGDWLETIQTLAASDCEVLYHTTAMKTDVTTHNSPRDVERLYLWFGVTPQQVADYLVTKAVMES